MRKAENLCDMILDNVVFPEQGIPINKNKTGLF